MVNTEEKQNFHQKLWRVAGIPVVSGYLESWIDYPLIGTKIRVQSGQSFVYKGFPSLFEYGYRGLVAFQISLLPALLVQMNFNSLTESWKLPSQNKNYQNLFHLTLAGTGGVLGAFIATPVEYVILAQQKSKVNPIEAIRTVVSRQGMSGLFTGNAANSMREFGFAASVWQGYQFSKDFLASHDIHNPVFAAMLSGSVGSFVSHAPDVIATKMQCNRLEGRRYDFFSVTQSLYKQGGLSAFYRGQGFGLRTLSIIGANFWLNKFSEMLEKATLAPEPSQTARLLESDASQSKSLSK